MKIKRWFVFSSFTALALVGLVSVTIYAKEQEKSNEPVDTVKSSTTNDERGVQQETIFSLLNGGTLSLADYRGKKPVILDFFATWCPNCRRNTPHLNELYKKYKDQVEIIAVNLHEDPAVVRQFADSYNLTFPVALDETSSIANQFDVRYTNTHVFIDLNGTVLRVVSGDVQERDIQVLIKR